MLNIQLPTLEHKYIKLYDNETLQESDIVNYEECCYWVIKNPNTGPDNETTYQYSVRTTNNDNEKLGHYYTVETADQWSGLEIIWGYFGWEWNDYIWNEQTYRGGNMFRKIPMDTVYSIPDGYRLAHINYFLGSQDGITSIESFDTSNIISAMNLNGYRPTDTVRNLTLAISDWNNVENARGMFENIQLTVANNVLNLPKAVDCSYIFNSVAGTTITFDWNFPLAENLSYAFYNVNGDIAPYDNNQFVQDYVTNIDYCFGADNLKQINVNISLIPTATTAKGLFRARIINNNNNVALPVCEYLDYALEECDLSRVNGINFTSNVLKSAKGLIKNSIINNTAGTFLDSLQYLTNFNLVEDFSEYLMDMNHDSTNNSITFDISGQTGEHSNVTLVDFCSNANINLKFIGSNKCIYDNFCQGGTLTIDTNSVFTGGLSYNNMFLGTTFNSTNLPVNTFEAGKEYNNLYNECTFNQPVNINVGNTVNSSENVFTDSVFNSSSIFDVIKLSNFNLDFSFKEVLDTYDITISDNTTDFGYGDEYVGYKLFSIRPEFNCRSISSQTINIYGYNDEYNVAGGLPNHLATKIIEVINNDYVEDLSNITLNIEHYNAPSDGYGYGLIMQYKLNSNSMTHSPIINFNTKHSVCSLVVDYLPNLVEFNASNSYSTDYRTMLNFDQPNLVYFRLGNYSGEVYLSSTILDVPTLETSILANNIGYYNFTIPRSIYNLITPSTLEVLIDRSTLVSIIEEL